MNANHQDRATLELIVRTRFTNIHPKVNFGTAENIYKCTRAWTLPVYTSFVVGIVHSLYHLSITAKVKMYCNSKPFSRMTWFVLVISLNFCEIVYCLNYDEEFRLTPREKTALETVCE